MPRVIRQPFPEIELEDDEWSVTVRVTAHRLGCSEATVRALSASGRSGGGSKGSRIT
jgi:hypothetical protein